MENFKAWRLILTIQKAIINSPNESLKKYLEAKRYILYRLVR